MSLPAHIFLDVQHHAFHILIIIEIIVCIRAVDFYSVYPVLHLLQRLSFAHDSTAVSKGRYSVCHITDNAVQAVNALGKLRRIVVEGLGSVEQFRHQVISGKLHGAVEVHLLEVSAEIRIVNIILKNLHVPLCCTFHE